MNGHTSTEAPVAELAQLGEVLGVFSRRYYDWLTERMRPLEVNPGRRKILRLLLENGPMTMSQLASELQLDPKRMTKLVDMLEESGFVERQTEQRDRRAKLVRVTDEGRRRWPQIDAEFAEIVSALVGQFSHEQRRQLLELARSMTDRITFDRAD